MSGQKSLLLAACLVTSACLMLGANGASARGGSHGGSQNQHDDQHRKSKSSDAERVKERNAVKSKAADKGKDTAKDSGKTATTPPAPASTAKTTAPAGTVQVHSGAIVTNTGIVGPSSAPATTVPVHSGAIVTGGASATPSNVVVRDHRDASASNIGPAATAPAAAPAAVSAPIHSGAIVTNGGSAVVGATPAAVVRDHRGAPAATPVAAPAPASTASSNVVVHDHRGDNAGYSNPSVGQAVKTGAGNFATQLKDNFVLGGKALGHEAKVATSAAASAAKSVYHFIGGLF